MAGLTPAPLNLAMLSAIPDLRRDHWPLLALACVWVGVTGVAQAATIQNLGLTEQFFFDTYGVESGLPGVAVNAVCQTRDGYLWIATGGGLARFDGVKFVSFRPTDTPALQTPIVYRCCEARDGTLWIGTARGLVSYRNRVFERAGLDDMEIHALAEDGAGRLWIGTFGGGLFVREEGQVRHVEAEVLSHARYIVRLVVDSRDRVWVGTDQPGLIYGQAGVFDRYKTTQPMDAVVESMCEQPAGTLWLGTRADGLYRLRDGELRHLGREEGMVGDEVSDLQPAGNGGVWIVSTKVQRLSNPDRPIVTAIPDVPRERVYSVYEDREGSVWLSAKERGLMRGGPMPFRLIAKRDGLPDDSVRSIAQDAAGNLWLAIQDHGLVQIAPDGAVLTRVSGENASAAERPAAVLSARDGTLWIGTPGVLHAWRDGEDQTYDELHGVYGLFEDRAGTIWIGTVSDGIYRYRDGQFVRIPLVSGKPVLHATSFCEGPDHTIYAATWSTGFVAIKEDRAVEINRASGLPTDEVRAVYVDADNHVWLGFRGYGLGLWENGHCWHPAALAQALFDHVSAIVEDSRGQLWLGTAAGVMWVARADLLAAARGEKDVAELRVAQVNRSLRTASVWTGPQSVVCTTHDQKFLFATREGVLAIDPARVQGRNLPPPVYIERVSVDGRRVDPATGITLAAGARNIVIDYTAPSFVDTSQVMFKHRLEGYDVDWVEAKAQRTVAYGNLAAGRYTFRVIACNADGVWNTEGASLVVVQRPHFYQTGWFFGLMGLGVVAAGIGLNRWSNHRLKQNLERLKEKQATERERRRIAKNLHDDLGANLTEISLSAEVIQQKMTSSELNADMTALSERVRALAGTLDAIVWSANPANDSLDRLATFVCGLFQDLCRMAGMRCRIDQPEPLPACPLSPDERSNLFLAAREAITNLAKHSAATEAWLRLKMDGSVFQLVLEDDGRGFDVAAAEASNRNGLANIRSRVAELKGTVRIDSAPGRGTTIVMRVPLKP